MPSLPLTYGAELRGGVRYSHKANNRCLTSSGPSPFRLTAMGERLGGAKFPRQTTTNHS